MPYPQYNNPNDRIYIGSPEDRLLLEAYSKPDIAMNLTGFQPIPQGLLTGTVGASSAKDPYLEGNYYGNGMNLKAAISEHVKNVSAGLGANRLGVEQNKEGVNPYYMYDTPNLQAKLYGGAGGTHGDVRYQQPAFSGLLGVEGDLSPQDKRIGFNWKKEF